MLSKEQALKVFSFYKSVHPALKGAALGVIAVLIGTVIWLAEWIYARLMPGTLAVLIPGICFLGAVVFSLRTTADKESRQVNIMWRVLFYAQNKFHYLAGFFLVLGIVAVVFQDGQRGLLFAALLFAVLGVLPGFLRKFRG